MDIIDNNLDFLIGIHHAIAESMKLMKNEYIQKVKKHCLDNQCNKDHTDIYLRGAEDYGSFVENKLQTVDKDKIKELLNARNN